MSGLPAIRDLAEMGWTVTDVIKATGARAGAVVPRDFTEICTDSRDIVPGSLFVALRGARHDGHDHAASALRDGATAVLVETVPPGVAEARTLRVADTLHALGDLASLKRRQVAPRVVAVTGSNGKTTTKEMLAAVCAGASFSEGRCGLLKTPGNWNNLVGLPLTLLRLRGDEAVAVLEMGMNVPGEIARLTQIADPDIGLITNIAAVHLEGLGTIEGVAAAKGELFAGMREQACIVVNTADERVRSLARGFRGRQVTFGPGAEVTATGVRDFGLDGIGFDLCIGAARARVRLRMPGVHNVSNALAAAAAAYALGIDVDEIARGLSTAVAPEMRLQVIRLANGVTVVNDGYNANPASLEAALRAVAGRHGRLVVVLGEMRELGDDSMAMHVAAGGLVVECGAGVLVATGPRAEDIARGARAAGLDPAATEVHAEVVAAARAVCRRWQAGDVVLLKGSRGADCEEAVRHSGSRMGELARLLREAAGGSH